MEILHHYVVLSFRQPLEQFCVSLKAFFGRRKGKFILSSFFHGFYVKEAQKRKKSILYVNWIQGKFLAFIFRVC